MVQLLTSPQTVLDENVTLHPVFPFLPRCRDRPSDADTGHLLHTCHLVSQRTSSTVPRASTGLFPAPGASSPCPAGCTGRFSWALGDPHAPDLLLQSKACHCLWPSNCVCFDIGLHYRVFSRKTTMCWCFAHSNRAQDIGVERTCGWMDEVAVI